MDIIFLIFIMVCIGLVLFALPLLLVYKLWSRGRYTKYLLCAALAAYVHVWFRAFFPEDAFFIGHMEGLAGISLQEDADVEKKYASYPDIHGDYAACALIKVSAADMGKLVAAPHPEYRMIDPEEKVARECFSPDLKLERMYYKESSGEWIYWGFNENSRQVFFYYWSA